MLFRWFWAQERFLFWHAPKFEIIDRLGRNFFPSLHTMTTGDMLQTKMWGKSIFIPEGIGVSLLQNIFILCKLFSLDSKSLYVNNKNVFPNSSGAKFGKRILHPSNLGYAYFDKNVWFDKYKSLLYGNPSLRHIPVLWLVLSWSRFCSTDRFHGNGQTRVFLFWSKAGKFKICNQNSKKKKLWTLSFFTVKLPEEAKNIEILNCQILNCQELQTHLPNKFCGTKNHLIKEAQFNASTFKISRIQCYAFGERCLNKLCNFWVMFGSLVWQEKCQNTSKTCQNEVASRQPTILYDSVQALVTKTQSWYVLFRGKICQWF